MSSGCAACPEEDIMYCGFPSAVDVAALVEEGGSVDGSVL